MILNIRHWQQTRLRAFSFWHFLHFCDLVTVLEQGQIYWSYSRYVVIATTRSIRSLWFSFFIVIATIVWARSHRWASSHCRSCSTRLGTRFFTLWRTTLPHQARIRFRSSFVRSRRFRYFRCVAIKCRQRLLLLWIVARLFFFFFFFRAIPLCIFSLIYVSM